MKRREWFRMTAAIGAGAVADALIPRMARGAWQQQPQDRLAAFRAQVGAVPIQTQRLGENLTMLSGPGGNVVVLHDDKGLLMVDTFVAPAWPKLEESLKTFGARVKIVINTHWHFDHTDNNASLRAAGATVVAHENTKRRMSTPQHIELLQLDFPPSPPGALPQRVFKDATSLRVNDEVIAVTHVRPAHTDTDVIVRFERANVLHAGDVFFNGRYPLIDGSTGGRVAGMIEACDRLLRLANADTKIVPGHGALAGRTELMKYRDMLATAADRVRKLKASGKSLEESIAAKPFTDLDGDWAGGRFKGDDFVKIVYLTL